jgi:site-specific recombinase XerD
MKTKNDKAFKIKLLEENGYVKFYISHKKFGRIKKHIGSGSIEDYALLIDQIKNELASYFSNKPITKDDVFFIIDEQVNRFKRGLSIFDFTEEFITKKEKTYNRNTMKYLSKSTIITYKRSIDYFKNFLIQEKLKPVPEIIDEYLLNDFLVFLEPRSYNYRVKLHIRLKSYITFLYEKKLPINESFKKSNFNEIYDNQEADKNDRALTIQEIEKLIELRTKFKKNGIKLPKYKKCKTISEKLQTKQMEGKLQNLKLTLDCFLFMVSTGMYYADINKWNVTIRNNTISPYWNYRRSKNNTYCKSIPLSDYSCFLGGTMMKEYNFTSNKKFPLSLSLDKFDNNLKILSELIGLDFHITSKMARKTFASILYFEYNMEINLLQTMLGHKDISTTMHYLRITEDDLAHRIMQKLNIAV